MQRGYPAILQRPLARALPRGMGGVARISALWPGRAEYFSLCEVVTICDLKLVTFLESSTIINTGGC